MASFAPDHPNIAAWPEPQPDYSRDLDLAGESFEAVMQAGPIVLSRLLDIAVRAAEDLSLCHAAGSVHGRLTADSIILDRNGGIKILFQDAFPKGSPQDDQLALGKVLQAALPATAGNPDSFRLVIDCLLALDPHDRYSSTRDLYLDLRAIRGRVPGPPELRPGPACSSSQSRASTKSSFISELPPLQFSSLTPHAPL